MADEDIRQLMRQGRTPRLAAGRIPELISLLATADLKLRFFAGRLLLRQGPRACPQLFSALASGPVETRRSAVHLLGLLGRQGKDRPGVVQALITALADEDTKVIKNAAVALGKLGDEAAVAALVQTLARPAASRCRASVLLALGALGGTPARDAVAAFAPQDAAEARAHAKALDRLLPSGQGKRLRPRLPRPTLIQLRVPPGLEKHLAPHIKGRPSSDGLLLNSRDPAALMAHRPCTELLLPLGQCPLGALSVKALVAAAVPLLQAAWPRLRAWYVGPGRLAYRLEMRLPKRCGRWRRELIEHLVPVLDALSPELANRPSAYALELRLEVRLDTINLSAKPQTLHDGRFAYRQRDVPAALAPPVAAALVRLLPPTRPRARVLDPFCGSATLLCERGFYRPYGSLVGGDISSQALQAASANLEASGLGRYRLVREDACRLEGLGRFDEILANLPFGLRSGDHTANKRLYQRFFKRLSALAAPGAHALLFTHELALTRRLLAAADGLTLVQAVQLQTGGLHPTAFIVRCS